MSKHINYIEAINAPTLAALIASLNEEKLTTENIIQIFCNNKGEYVAIYIK